ncbi:MAG TPA: long-chain fatty acid--CoA ligase [Aldersonia sp.]
MSDTISPDELTRAPSWCAVFQTTSGRRPDAIAVRSSDGHIQLTWRQLGGRVRRVAAGLAALGVARGDTVALMLTNRPEFHVVDLAVMHLGATPFSIYNTSSRQQLEHAFSTAGNRVVVCDGQFVERIRATRGVAHIVSVDGPADGAMGLAALEAAGDPYFDFDAAWRAVGHDDLATLIFTSGTTGAPKAVELTHANVLYSISTVLHFPESLGASVPGAQLISYLPDAHMANRRYAHYLPIATGATIVTVRDAKTLPNVLREVHPTMLGGVPMIWYKLRLAVEQRLAAETSPVASLAPETGERKQALVNALELGTAKVRHAASGSPLPADLRERYAEADLLVLSPLRAELGLDRLVTGVSGGAPIAAETLEFFMSVGIPVLEGWAMSETSGTGVLNPPQRIRPGSVGVPMPGTEVTLADDGELLVRSPGLTRGYRNDPVKSAEAIDADGWLHTGDIATIDADGYVSIIDRKKELIINAAGKNMSPANIENAVKTACPLVGSVMAVGDRRPYVVALVTLDPDAAPRFARAHGLADASPTTLSGDPRVRADVQAGIDRANATLSRVEQIKSFTILPTYWLPDSEELTPTMKLRRRVIDDKYAAYIEAIYSRPRTLVPSS